MNQSPAPGVFYEGDIFYTISTDNYYFVKLLKADTDLQTYHVLMYEPTTQFPAEEKELQVMIYHTPIAQEGFKEPQLFRSGTPITYEEMGGYYEYLKQTENYEELAAIANTYFLEAYQLTDLMEHEAAIENYSHAIDLIPQYFEAIDNRAFCKMDLGRWHDAIEDFQFSLAMNPNGFMAEFSIGECYLRLKEYESAVVQFEKARVIDPTHPLPIKFLEKVKQAMR